MHFSCLVISTEGEVDYDSQLEPFGQNPDSDYLEFQIEIENTADFKQLSEDILNDAANCLSGNVSLYSRLTDLHLEGKYSDLVKEYEGYEEDDEGNLGYYGNPNSQWDWYSVGGRWDGFFKAKEGTISDEEDQEFMVMTPPGVGPLRLNIITKRNIDFEGMLEETQKEHALAYDNEIARLERFAKEGVVNPVPSITKLSKEDYVAQAKPIDVYALIIDGDWYEEGACYDGNGDLIPLWDLIDKCPDESKFMIIDCHM